jgi:hypothetical protein
MGTVSVTAPGEGGEPAAMIATVAWGDAPNPRFEPGTSAAIGDPGADTSLQAPTTAVTESPFLW